MKIELLKQYLVEVIARMESWSFARFESLKTEPWAEDSGNPMDILNGHFFQADIELLEETVDAGVNVLRVAVFVDNSIQYLGAELYVGMDGRFKWDRTFGEFLNGVCSKYESIDT